MWTPSSIKIMEENLDDAQDGVIDVVDKAFNIANEKVYHLYPDLELSELNLVKVIKDGQLVDEDDTLDQERAFPIEGSTAFDNA
ncbi:hypothetical protein KIW84_063341 [Lathyrus oleraceus]|uniref:Uncharacterized protein n=1 Tax=Pisum sativum TaxID=3888 RepID=A0A9D4W8I5_PEA|nr:hypothetical protein KIW84_063341 [Pisum sativum]